MDKQAIFFARLYYETKRKYEQLKVVHDEAMKDWGKLLYKEKKT